MPAIFERVLILGVGLLGGSLGLALRTRGLAQDIVGLGRSRDRLDEAVRRGAVSRAHLLQDHWPQDFSLLVLAVPVEQIGALLKTHRAKIPARTLITDVGSTKACVVPVCHEVLGPGHRYVGSHPIAGSHHTGVAHADPDLFQDRVCVITPTQETHPDAVERVAQLWRSIGSRVVMLSPEEHDRLVARTSHLPHMTAAALCTILGRSYDSRIRDLVGQGFRDTTRIAAGEPRLWTEICRHNREEISSALDQLIEELNRVKSLLDKGDFPSVMQFLDQARVDRARLCSEQSPPNVSSSGAKSAEI